MAVGIKQHCSKKYCLLLRMYCLMGAFTSVCVAIILGVNGMHIQAALTGLLSAAILGTFLAMPLYSGRISYTRIGGGIRVESGNFVRRVTVVSRRDIKNAQISRSFMQRRFGLCTLVFATPSGHICLKGIDYDDGRRLKYLFGGEDDELE